MFKYKDVKTLKSYKEKEKKNLSGIHKYQRIQSSSLDKFN